MDLFHHLPVPAFHLDEDGTILLVNSHGPSLLHLPEQSLLQTDFASCLPQEHRQEFSDFLHRVKNQGQSSVRVPLLLPDSSRLSVAIKGSTLAWGGFLLLLDKEHEETGSSDPGKTLTMLQKEINHSEKGQVFLNGMLDHIQDGIIACDTTGRLTILNSTGRSLYQSGLAGEKLSESEPLKAVNQRKNNQVKLDATLARILAGTSLQNDEVVLDSPGGTALTFRVNGRAMYDADNNKLGAVLTLHNITDLEKARSQLRFYAYHDTLTQLPNRRLFHNLLKQALKQAKRYEKMVGVLFADLDYFKTVNDRFGHHTGDQLLTSIAAILQENLRSSDLICRWGGDEFVIGLLDNVSRESIAGVAEKLCSTVRAAIDDINPEFGVSISIGIAIYPDHGLEPDLLIRNADMALYLAKRQGRNRYQVYPPENDPNL